MQQVPEILQLRNPIRIQERPYIIWEPFPGACKTPNRDLFLEACKLVDVFSPNHLEIAALFNDTPSEEFQPKLLESHALEFLNAIITGESKHGAIVTRAGIHGSLTMYGDGEHLWLPAFHEDWSAKVVDPTGAGNTFLGGFMAGWNRSKDVKEASVYGNVAASFAVGANRIA